MTTKNIKCQKCNSNMEVGFIVEHSQGGNTVSTWSNGLPEKSFWTGIKLSGKKMLPIETYRCERCGYLESYAPQS